MTEELATIAPMLHRQVVIVEQPALIEPQMTPEARTLEEVRAVDAAFSSGSDQTDAAIGTMGLYLCAPWLVDFLADQFAPPRAEEEEYPHPGRKRNDDED